MLLSHAVQHVAKAALRFGDFGSSGLVDDIDAARRVVGGLGG